MNSEQFRQFGHQLIDMIADYHENAESHPVLAASKPGEVTSLLPKEAPEDGEPFESVIQDMNKVVFPHITHWQHPMFMAFFSANTSYPAILGELMSAGLGVQGMLWTTSPACTEMETVMMDWLARLLKLPEEFLSETKVGGGVIQGTASEAVVVCLVASRFRKLGPNDGQNYNKFVVYVSDQTHSSVQKGCQITGIPLSNLRVLPTSTEKESFLSLRVETLKKAIEEDKANGLIPGFVCASIGTTATTAIDDVMNIGKLCADEGIWFHMDAAFSGSACICPEFRPMIDGVEYADSFNFNPHKWLLVNFDCSALWLKKRSDLVNALSIVPEYLRNKASESGEIIDYRDWQIPLGRRFRALKLWFVMRTYGANGLRDFIRKHVESAKQLEQWITDDARFEIFSPRTVSLVCFRVRDQTDEFHMKLLEVINSSGKLYITHAKATGKIFLRVAIAGTHTTAVHVKQAWDIITASTTQLLSA